MAVQLDERFWSKVNKSGRVPAHAPHLGHCWEWTASKRAGYGAFRVDGKIHGAHRLSYQAHSGDTAEGLDVDHICWTRSCVRPSHMRAVTRSENMHNQTGVAASNKTGFRGVYYASRDKYFAACVKVNGRTSHIGIFATAEDANDAASKWRREHMPHSEMDKAA